MKTEEKTYNGWTNYETWNVKLWIDNEQGTQEYWQEAAQDALESADADQYFTKVERAILNLSDRLKDEYEDIVQDFLESSKMSASFISDLLGAALSQVNWHEIAESLIEDREQ